MHATKNGASLSSKLLFIISSNNTIRVWDIRENKLAATMYINESGKQYCVISPEGRFDARDGDFSSLYYVKDLNTIPLTATFEKFYTPSLLARILNREKSGIPVVNAFDKIGGKNATANEILMNKLLQVARIADQQGNTVARDQIVATVKARLENCLKTDDLIIFSFRSSISCLL